MKSILNRIWKSIQRPRLEFTQESLHLRPKFFNRIQIRTIRWKIDVSNPPAVQQIFYCLCIAYDLPGLYLLAGGNADGRTVGVQCFQPATVVDLNVVAVATAPAVKTVGNGNCSVCSGEDRRTLSTGMSVPVWELTSPVMGSTRWPNCEVIVPATGSGHCRVPVGVRVLSGFISSPPPCAKPPSNSAHSSSYRGSCRSCK